MSGGPLSGVQIPSLSQTPVGEQLVVMTQTGASPSPAEEHSSEHRAGSATTLSSFATSHDTTLSPSPSLTTPIGQSQRKPLKTEYKANFRPFDQYVYNEITDTFTIPHPDRQLSGSRSNHDLASPSRDGSARGSGGAHVPTISLSVQEANVFEPLNGSEHPPSSQEPWYKEVTKRHEKANEYRFKSEVGHNSPLLHYNRADSPYSSERQITSPGGLDSLVSDQYTLCDIRSQHSDQQNDTAHEHKYKFTPHDYKRDSLIANMANNNNFAPPKEQASNKTATPSSAGPRRAQLPAARTMTRSTAQSRSRSQSTRRPVAPSSAGQQVTRQAQPATKSNQTTPTKAALNRASTTSKTPTTPVSRAPATPRVAAVSRVSSRPTPASNVDDKAASGGPAKRSPISTTSSRMSARPTNGSNTVSSASRLTSSTLAAKKPVSQPMSRTITTTAARSSPRPTSRTATSTGTSAIASGRLPATGVRAPPSSRTTSSTASTNSAKSKTTPKTSAAPSGTTAIKSIKTPKALAAQEASAAAAAALVTTPAVATGLSEISPDSNSETSESAVDEQPKPRVDEHVEVAKTEQQEKPLQCFTNEGQNLLFTTTDTEVGHMLADELAQAEQMASAAAKVPELNLDAQTPCKIEDEIVVVDKGGLKETKIEASDVSANDHLSEELVASKSGDADLINGLADGLVSAEDRFDSSEREMSADMNVLEIKIAGDNPTFTHEEQLGQLDQQEQETNYDDEPYSLMPTAAVDSKSDVSASKDHNVEMLEDVKKSQLSGESDLLGGQQNDEHELNADFQDSQDLCETDTQSALSLVKDASGGKAEPVSPDNKEDVQGLSESDTGGSDDEKEMKTDDDQQENSKSELSCDPIPVEPSNAAENLLDDRQLEAANIKEPTMIEQIEMDRGDDDKDVMPNQQIQGGITGNVSRTEQLDSADYDNKTVSSHKEDQQKSTLVETRSAEDRSVEIPKEESEVESEVNSLSSETELSKVEPGYVNESRGDTKHSSHSDANHSQLLDNSDGDQPSEERMEPKEDIDTAGSVSSVTDNLQDSDRVGDLTPASALISDDTEPKLGATNIDSVDRHNDPPAGQQSKALESEKPLEELLDKSKLNEQNVGLVESSQDVFDVSHAQSEVSLSDPHDQQTLTGPKPELDQQQIAPLEHEVAASRSADEDSDSDHEGNNKLDDSTDYESDQDGRHKELLMSAADLMYVEFRQKEEMARKSELARKNSSPQPTYRAGEVILSPDQLNEHFNQVTTNMDTNIKPSIDTFDDSGLFTKTGEIESKNSVSLDEHQVKDGNEKPLATLAPESSHQIATVNSYPEENTKERKSSIDLLKELSGTQMDPSEKTNEAESSIKIELADGGKVGDDVSKGHSDLDSSEQPTNVDLNDDGLDSDEQLKLSNHLTNSEDELILEPRNYNYAPKRSESPSRYNEGAGLDIVSSQHEDLIDSSVDIGDGSSAAIEIPTVAENRVEMSSAAKTHLQDISPSKCMMSHRISLDSDDDIELDDGKDPIDLAATFSPGEADELLRFNPITESSVLGSTRQQEKVEVDLGGAEGVSGFPHYSVEEAFGFSEMSEKAIKSAELAEATAGQVEKITTAPGSAEIGEQAHGELHRQLSLSQDERLKLQQQQSGALISEFGSQNIESGPAGDIESQYNDFAARMTAGITLTAKSDNNNITSTISNSGNGQISTETPSSDRLLE